MFIKDTQILFQLQCNCVAFLLCLGMMEEAIVVDGSEAVALVVDSVAAEIMVEEEEAEGAEVAVEDVVLAEDPMLQPIWIQMLNHQCLICAQTISQVEIANMVTDAGDKERLSVNTATRMLNFFVLDICTAWL